MKELLFTILALILMGLGIAYLDKPISYVSSFITGIIAGYNFSIFWDQYIR
jgi:hypothetical protein